MAVVLAFFKSFKLWTTLIFVAMCATSTHNDSGSAGLDDCDNMDWSCNATSGDGTSDLSPVNTASSSTTTVGTENRILETLRKYALYIGIAGGGLVIILSILSLICLCICCSKCRKGEQKAWIVDLSHLALYHTIRELLTELVNAYYVGEKSEKKKKKKKKLDGSALWSEGGNVQLLSLAEKAEVVEGTAQPEPEANEKGPEVGVMSELDLQSRRPKLSGDPNWNALINFFHTPWNRPRVCNIYGLSYLCTIS